MTIHDALDHPWLREDRPELDSRIPSNRFDTVRQRIRARYVRIFENSQKKNIFCFYRRTIQIRLSVSVVWLIGVHSERLDHKIIISIAASGVTINFY
jgi:hypothetical protein